jgi:anti-sigma regulatory factor (Ser/Thr protein kinase)
VSKDLSIVLVNQRREIERLADLLSRFGADHRLSDDDIFAMNLALDELVMNIINHAYEDDRAHEIRVRLEIDGRVCRISVEDDGRPFNPLDVPPPNLDLPIEERPIGGLGLHLVRAMVSTFEYRREGSVNRVILERELSS